MLHFAGRKNTLAQRFNRRDLLNVGGLGLMGLSLVGFLRLRAASAAAADRPSRFGQATACILIHLFGAHPSHETFDPKPDAPTEVQGELGAIATNVPGVLLGEGLPQLAQVADRTTIVRSLTHALPFHGVHYTISGIPTISPTVEADPNDRQLWPSIGSVVDYLDDRRGGERLPPLPRNIGLPFVLYSKANFRPLGGPYGGFLGSRYDPVWTEFSAPGTKPVPNPTAKADLYDPFGGIAPADRFDLAGPASLPE